MPPPLQQVPLVQLVVQHSLVIEQLPPVAVHCAATDGGAISHQMSAAMSQRVIQCI
jgi:hypothetical protein